MKIIKSLKQHFNNGLSPDQLLFEINNDLKITSECVNVRNLNSDKVIIKFSTDLLPEQESYLESVISSHAPKTGIPGTIYDAIVDSSGNGDYLLPSDAFIDGHISVFLKNGVYKEPRNIVLPDHGSITGESGGNVVIHFLGKSNGIIADGSNGLKEVDGVISVTNLSRDVVGKGTGFTNLKINSFILIGTNYYKIDSIIDDTHLKLSDIYRGINASDITYMAQNMLTGIMLNKLIITGSTSSGLYLRACWHFSLISVAFKQNSPNLSIIDCGDSATQHVLIEYGNESGIIIKNSVSISFDTVDVYNNEKHGIYVIGYSESLIFKSCETSNNGDCGFYVGGTYCIDLCITTSVIKSNVNDGIYLGNNSKNFHITQLTCRCNGGCGIYSSGHEHNISSNICNDNKKSGIFVGGDDSIIGSNICKRNSDSGIKIKNGTEPPLNNSVKNNMVSDTDFSN